MVTQEIKLSNGWCQSRVDPKISKAVVGLYCDAKGKIIPDALYRMKPIYDISKITLKPISVFDVNFIETFIRMKANINRYGRKWAYSPVTSEYRFLSTTRGNHW